jgi:hypothetical protein
MPIIPPLLGPLLVFLRGAPKSLRFDILLVRTRLMRRSPLARTMGFRSGGAECSAPPTPPDLCDYKVQPRLLKDHYYGVREDFGLGLRLKFDLPALT